MADGQGLVTLYSTADARSVADYIAAAYSIRVGRCDLLRRGFNDIYEVAGGEGERYVFRLGTRRARGAPNVDYETALLSFLRSREVPVAEPVARSDGRLWASVALPEGDRSAVLFRFIPGRDPDLHSPLDAAAQGETLARVHAAASGYGGPTSLYRLDLGFLLHRPLAAFLALPALEANERGFFEALAARLDAAVTLRAAKLSTVECHGDCHGGNALIGEDGQHRRATFFDFDDGGPGWLAYDLAVFLWSRRLSGNAEGSATVWPAFLAGYRGVREIPPADIDAVPLFVAIRHFWLLGEYARRVNEGGTQSLPGAWIKRQADFLRGWDETELSPLRLL